MNLNFPVAFLPSNLILDNSCLVYLKNTKETEKILNIKYDKFLFYYKHAIYYLKNNTIETFDLRKNKFRKVFTCKEKIKLITVVNNRKMIILFEQIGFKLFIGKKLINLNQINNKIKNFDFITSIAWDERNKLLIMSNEFFHNITAISKAGIIKWEYGKKLKPKNEINYLCSPQHVFVYKNRIIISDSMNNRVVVISDKGRYIYSFGEINNDFKIRMKYPTFAMISTSGEMLIADSDNQRCIKIKKNKILSIYGNLICKSSPLNYPRIIRYADDNNFFVSDTLNNDIKLINLQNNVLWSYKNFNLPSLYWPRAICIYDNIMAIADSLNNRIILINYKENKIIKIILQNKLKGFLFLDVHYIEFVNSKTIIVVDSESNTVYYLDIETESLTETNYRIKLKDPHMAKLNESNLVIADTGNKRIHIYNNIKKSNIIIETETVRAFDFVDKTQIVFLGADTGTIFIYSLDGKLINTLKTPYPEIKHTRSIIYKNNNIYACDYHQWEIKKIEL